MKNSTKAMFCAIAFAMLAFGMKFITGKNDTEVIITVLCLCSMWICMAIENKKQ